MSTRLQYFDGFYTLVLETKGGDNSVSIKFHDPHLFDDLAKDPYPSKVVLVAKGEATYEFDISQTGSAWDNEEAVVGEHIHWTCEGVFSLTLCNSIRGELIIVLDTDPPYINPYPKRDEIYLVKPKLEISNVPDLYLRYKLKQSTNSWGYDVHNAGEIFLTERTGQKTTAHIIQSNHDEALFFTPETNIPVYEARCGESSSNKGVTIVEFEEINSPDSQIEKCQNCFPKYLSR